MRPQSLRTRLLLASSAILAGLIAATLLYVGWQANQFVGERLAADLRRTQELAAAQEAVRHETLRATARLLAAFPELRALIATDAATVRDFLVDYRNRSGRLDLIAALDPSGRVVARTDTLVAAPLPGAAGPWLADSLKGPPATGVLEAESGTYEVAVAPGEAAGTVFGFVLVGLRVDRSFARALSDQVGDEVVVLGRGGLLGATLQADLLPWHDAAAWDAAADRGAAGRAAGEATADGRAAPDPIEVTIGTERYAAAATRLRGSDAVRLVMLQSRDRALAPYRRIQAGLLALGLVGTLAGIALSAWLARSLTAPLASLADGTRRVAAGEYEFALDESRRDELGALARSFNVMTRGLRERVEMQRFVSQSTVQMIRARATRPASAGERRRLTILITDLRGFTGFAEAHAPEEVVAVLNRTLSVQAARVARFGGDVDKFIGDSLVSLFEGQDMALRAIRCAVEIQQALASELEGAGTPLAAGIGIATGEVVLGSIGSDERLDYTAIGSHVNLASRLCAMAGPGEVLLAAATFDAVRDFVGAERLEDVAIRGLQEPVTVYRMRGRAS
jgi:class 3 adenylate cyclase